MVIGHFFDKAIVCVSFLCSQFIYFIICKPSVRIVSFIEFMLSME